MGKLASVFAWGAGLLACLFVLYLLFYFLIPYFLAPDSLNRPEAQALLDSELQRYRQKRYSELVLLVGKSERKEVTGLSGTRYQLVISGYWDGKPQEDIRVAAAIDDGGRSAWIPMTDSFILSPSGVSVGE
jgi:hypothetical protein